MTTFQGLPEGKNSSRVLRPPGGGDSNIFGAGDTQSQPRKKCIAQPASNNIFGPPTEPQNPQRKQREDTSSNIFGAADAEQQSPEQTSDKKEKDEENEEEVKNNNDEPPPRAQNKRISAKPTQGSVYNPITGEGGPDNSPALGTRGRQPPGGFSTKLW